MSTINLSNLLPSALALLSVVFALLALWRQFRSSQPDKELSVEILANASLHLAKGVQNETETSIPLTDEMRVISVRVRNTGRAEILSSDYLEPIRLRFDEPILSSALTEKKGTISSAPLEPEIDQDVVVLPAIRLHPKGFITINTLLSGGKSSITVKGLIAGGQIVMVSSGIQPIFGS